MEILEHGFGWRFGSVRSRSYVVSVVRLRQRQPCQHPQQLNSLIESRPSVVPVFGIPDSGTKSDVNKNSESGIRFFRKHNCCCCCRPFHYTHPISTPVDIDTPSTITEMRARPSRGKRDDVNLVVEKSKDKDKGKGKGKSKEEYKEVASSLDEPGKSSIGLMEDSPISRTDRNAAEHPEQPALAHNRSVLRAEAGKKTEPVFEMVVLGSGGGPLETDCSG
jgi:hypothetical protein